MNVIDECIELRNIKAGVFAADWRESISASGSLLVDSGCITAEYIQQMIQSVEKFGPYIVLMPGLALAHARPCSSVLKTGISLITLKEPVYFASEHDPVSIVMTLACADSASHLEMLGAIAMKLTMPGRLGDIAAAKTAEQIYALINGSSDS